MKPPEDLKKTTLEALERLRSNPKETSEMLFWTRDFFGWDVTQEEFEEAWSLAESKWKEATLILEGELGEKGKVVRKSDPEFSWLPVDEAKYWSTEIGHLILYWEHEDKEAPCDVQIYRFHSADNHELKEMEEEGDHHSFLYFQTSDEEKIAMLDDLDTSMDDWLILFEYCRSFPNEKVIAAAKANLFRLYDLPEHYNLKDMEMELKAALKEAQEISDEIDSEP